MIWKVTLVFAAAAVLAAALRRSSAAVRHSVWTLALGASLAIPAASWLPPVAVPDAISLAVTAASTTAAPPAFDWMRMAWLAGAVAVALRFAVGHLRAWRLVRSSEPIARREGVEIRRAPEGVLPMTWGLARPVVLLPEGESRESILRHELAHARRLDHWWLLLTQAACSVYWFHPLAWLAARSSAAERERACDDLVLGAGETPAGYAETLVEVAKSAMAAPSATLAAVGQTPLESRIHAILDPRVDRRPARRGLIAAGVCAALLVALPVAAQKVYKVGNGVTPPRLKSKVEPKYTEAARTEKISGAVKLYAEVDEDGLARNIRVIEPLDAGLDANAIKAVEQWRFEPGKLDGKAVRVAATIEVNFRLE